MQKIIQLFFLIIVQQSFGQFTVSGFVKTKEDKPIANAHIHVGNKYTSSNSEGYYVILNLSSGKQAIDFSKLGYIEKDLKIDLIQDLVLDVILDEDVKSIEEINVISLMNNKKSFSQKETVISQNKIIRYSTSSLGEALKEITGVSSLRAGNSVSKPVIGGLHSNRIIILNQNVRLEDQQWGLEHTPSIDINSAGKITVIKGASALQYGGDAIGGFVIIEPLKIVKDTIFGKSLLSLQSNGMGGVLSSSFFNHKVKGFSYSIEGSVKYFGDRKSATYNLTNTGNREQNFSASVSHISENNKVNLYYSFFNSLNAILSSSNIGNVNDLYNSIQNQTPYVIEDFSYNISNPKQDIQHHLLKLSDEFVWNNYNFNIQYAFQNNKREEYDLRRGFRNNIPALDLELKTHSFSVVIQKNFSKLNFKSGLNTQFQSNFSNPETGIRPLIPSFSKNDFGGFTSFVYQFDEHLSMDFGLRYDYSKINATKFYIQSRWIERGYNITYPQFLVLETGNQYLTKPKFDYHIFSGSIGVKKIFHHGYKGYLNLSVSSRNPNVNELFSDGLHRSNGQIESGNLSLKREQSYKFSVTAEKDTGKFNFEISPYINRINGFIYLKPTGFENTIRGSYPTWDYLQTNALLTGIDMSGSYQLTNLLTYETGIAYVNGRDITKNDYLIDMPPLKLVNSLELNQNNKSKFNYLIRIKSEYFAVQKNYPDFDFETNIIKDNKLLPVTVSISKPPKAYHLFSIYGETYFKLWKTNTTFALSVDNLFNEAYRDYLNKQRFFADDLGRNILIQIKFNY